MSPASSEPIGRDERGFALLPLAKDNYVLENAGTPNPQLKGSVKPQCVLKAKKPMDALVVELSRKAHHATLADFKKAVLANPLHLKAQNPFFGCIVTYKGCAPEAKELYLNLGNQEVPRIAGKYISYQCPAFDSGVVTLTGPISGKKVVLDFNTRSPKK